MSQYYISHYLSLTLCTPIDFSIQFNTVKSGWCSIHIEGPQVIITTKIVFLTLKIYFFFVLAISANPDEMLHYTAFYLDHCLQKHPFRDFLYTMG